MKINLLIRSFFITLVYFSLKADTAQVMQNLVSRVYKVYKQQRELASQAALEENARQWAYMSKVGNLSDEEKVICKGFFEFQIEKMKARSAQELEALSRVELHFFQQASQESLTKIAAVLENVSPCVKLKSESQVIAWFKACQDAIEKASQVNVGETFRTKKIEIVQLAPPRRFADAYCLENYRKNMIEAQKSFSPGKIKFSILEKFFEKQYGASFEQMEKDYTILDLSQNASLQDVEKNFRTKSLAAKQSNVKEYEENVAQPLNDAHSRLKNWKSITENRPRLHKLENFFYDCEKFKKEELSILPEINSKDFERDEILYGSPKIALNAEVWKNKQGARKQLIKTNQNAQRLDAVAQDIFLRIVSNDIFREELLLLKGPEKTSDILQLFKIAQNTHNQFNKN